MRVDSQQKRDSHNACVCVFLSVSFSLLCCDSWPVASETAIGVVGPHFPSVLLLGLCLGIFPQNLVKYLNFSCCVGYPWNCLEFWDDCHGYSCLFLIWIRIRVFSYSWFWSTWHFGGMIWFCFSFGGGRNRTWERVYRFVTSIMDEILWSDGLTWNAAALWFWIWRCWLLFHVEFPIPYGL